MFEDADLVGSEGMLSICLVTCVDVYCEYGNVQQRKMKTIDKIYSIVMIQ